MKIIDLINTSARYKGVYVRTCDMDNCACPKDEVSLAQHLYEVSYTMVDKPMTVERSICSYCHALVTGRKEKAS